MDRIPELYLGFLGILKIGAIAQPLFSAFGDESLFVRLDNAETTAIITQKKHAPKVRKILDKLPHLRHIIVVDHDGVAPLKDREVAFSLEKSAPVEHFDIHPTKAESPSVLHYTSGTTGMPKGVQHVHYSLISQYLTAKWVLDLRDDDIYWCTADPGWVTGTSYGIIAPWALGVTQCVLDAGFSAEAWYRFIEKRKVTIWYSAPTAIRSLMKAGDEIVKKFDLSSPPPPGQRRRTAQLRGGGLVGEGLRPALPRHLLADRDRLDHDHQLPGHEGQAGLDGQALPRHHRHRPRPVKTYEPITRPTARSA